MRKNKVVAENQSSFPETEPESEYSKSTVMGKHKGKCGAELLNNFFTFQLPSLT